MVFPLAAVGGIVSGIGSALGGMFGANAAKSGAKKAAKSQLKASRQNLRFQKQFAQRGIQWKVRDAKKAGINPLAALGAQTMSFAPSFVGTGDGGQAAAGAALQQGFSGMGQGFGRAIEAYSDSETRSENNMYLRALQAKQLENIDLQNQALASQIQNMNQAGRPPALNVNKTQVVAGQGADVNQVPSVQPGYIPDTQRIASGRDSMVVVPSEKAKSAVEDAMIPETQMAIRHNMDLIVDPRSGWTGKLTPNDEVEYNPFTGRLSKYDKRASWAIINGGLRRTTGLTESKDRAESAYRQRKFMEWNAPGYR